MNYKLGLKYKTDCRLALILDINKATYQMVVWSLSADKIVDSFKPLTLKQIEDADNSGLNLYIKDFNKDSKLSPILHKNFCKQCGVSLGLQSKKIIGIINNKSNKNLSVLHSAFIINYLKALACENKGYNTLHEKHLGIILVYGFNLSLSNAKKLIKET